MAQSGREWIGDSDMNTWDDDGSEEDEKMANPVLVLGRDGMGETNEQSFDAWVAFVNDNIDARVKFRVDVEERGIRDVQDDGVTGGTDEQRTAIAEAKADLWELWCAEGAPAS